MRKDKQNEARHYVVIEKTGGSQMRCNDTDRQTLSEIRILNKSKRGWLHKHFKMPGCEGLLRTLRTDSSAYLPEIWRRNATEDRAVASERANALIEILSATGRTGVSKRRKT
jgi:hypothetical protein